MTTSLETVPETAGGTDWAGLRRQVAGRLVTPTDPDWALARMPWIVNVDQQPAAVLEVAHPGDVVTAVRWAAENAHAVSAQPTGHAPRTTLDGTLLLRTRALGGIEVDAGRRVASVGAGVKWGELLAALDGTGLVALAGSNPDPSVVGLTLGGGVSWFTRKHGFTANSVVAFDVVDPTGALVHVTRASDPELFWALRGGGGDFGIVVRVELALFPAPDLYGGRLMWPVEHAAAVLKAFRDVALTAPPELSVWAHVYHFPPMPDLPEPIRGRSFVGIAATHLGSAAEAERLLAPLRAAAPVEMDLMGEVPVGRLGEVAAEPTDPMPGMEHSMLLHGLDDCTIDKLVAVVADPRTSPLAVVQIRGLGGAFGAISSAHGAVTPVTAAFQLFALGVPAVPELAAAIPHAFAAIDAAVGHYATGRRMPNFSGDGQDDTAGYDPATLVRLQEIKRSRDPLGVIRSNKPVLGV